MGIWCCLYPLHPFFGLFGDFFFFFKSFLVRSTDFRKYLFNERAAGRARSWLGPEHWLASVGPSTGLRRLVATHRPAIPGIPGPCSALTGLCRPLIRERCRWRGEADLGKRRGGFGVSQGLGLLPGSQAEYNPRTKVWGSSPLRALRGCLAIGH